MFGTASDAPTDPNYSSGDPDGLSVEGGESSSRSLPFVTASPWSGWPSEWGIPNWNSHTGLHKLVDTAWTCLDLNASVLSTMPVYRLQSGQIANPVSWMSNPDPLIYSSWQEFSKQLFWDYQLGEVFVLPMSRGANGFPLRMRVVPPWLVNVEMSRGGRRYSIGNDDVSDDILHIRYQSSTDDAHGHGPLECAGARLTQAALLQRYAHTMIESGGVPQYWIEVERRLSKNEADDLLDQWVESRTRHAGHPALLSGGAGLRDLKAMSA